MKSIVSHASQPFRSYFSTLRTLLFSPTPFFSALKDERTSLEHGTFKPLTFALVTHWIGSAFQYLWNAWIGGEVEQVVGSFQSVIQEVVDPNDFEDFRGLDLDRVNQVKDQVLHWFMGAGSVIIDPFSTLFSLLFTSLLIWIGARILVTPGQPEGPRSIRYESALQLVAYSTAPAILGFIPLMGSPLASVLSLILLILGAREVYRIGIGRAAVIALFPKLVFVVLVGWILILGALALLKFVSGMV
jgi:hypothetical protein